MKTHTFKWFISAALAVAMATGASAIFARPQFRSEPHPGGRADRREDRREIKEMRFRINEDQETLDVDVRRFGRSSPQAREDRRRLRADKLKLKQLQRDLRRDRRIDARDPV